MSSESRQKSTKALTTLVGLFLLCIISENFVDGKSVQKAPTTKDPQILSEFKDGTKYILPDSQATLSVLISSAEDDMLVDKPNGNPLNQITMSTLLSNSILDNSDNRISKLARPKRSPYPPGFVAWTWKEPCFCPPGQYFSCRCYYSNKIAGMNSASSEEGNNSSRKRRRSRSKKLKLKV